MTVPIGQYKQPSEEVLASLAESEQLGSPSEEQDQGGADENAGGTNDDGKTAEEIAAAKKAEAESNADEGGSKGDETGDESGAADENGDKGKTAEEIAAEKAKESVYEYEGTEYKKDALDAILADHLKNVDWKATNTQEAQKLAAASKGIKNVQDLLKKISADSDAVELLADLDYDLSEKGVKELLSDIADQGSGDEGGEGAGGEADTRSDLEKRLDNLEADREFEKAWNGFMADEKMREAYDTAEKQNKLMEFMTKKGILDFIEGHKTFTADQTLTDQAKRIEELEKENKQLAANKSPNAPVDGQGAVGTTDDQTDGPVHGDTNYSAARKKLRKALNLD